MNILDYPISGLVLEAAFNTMEDEAHYLGGALVSWLNLVNNSLFTSKLRFVISFSVSVKKAMISW